MRRLSSGVSFAFGLVIVTIRLTEAKEVCINLLVMMDARAMKSICKAGICRIEDSLRHRSINNRLSIGSPFLSKARALHNAKKNAKHCSNRYAWR